MYIITMIKVKLKEFLDQHNLSAYRVGQEVERMHPKTVQMYASGTRTPQLENLNEVIRVLRKLTGKHVQVSDLLEYEPEPELDEESRVWLEAPLAPPIEPYDWEGADPTTLGQPVTYQPGVGFVVEGGKRAK